MKEGIIVCMVVLALLVGVGIHSNSTKSGENPYVIAENSSAAGNSLDKATAPGTAGSDAQPKPTQDKSDQTKIVEGKLIIGDERNPLLEITRGVYAKGSKYEDIIIDDRIRSNLKEIILRALQLTKSSKDEESNKFVLKLAAGFMSYLTTGDRDIADLSKKISHVAIDAQGNSIVQLLTNVNTGTLALGVMQVLSTVVSQKYLADIDMRLENIETDIADIKTWLENEQVSNLTGTYKYLYNIASNIKNYRYSDVDLQTFNNQLESIELDCTRITEFYKLELNNPLTKIKNADLTSLTAIGLKQNYQDMVSYIDAYEKNILPYLFAIHVRAVEAQLKCALPVERSVAMSRFKELELEMTHVKSNMENFYNITSGKIGTLNSSFSFNKTNMEYRTQLMNYLKTAMAEITEKTKEIDTILANSKSNLSRQMEEFKKPLEIEITVNKNGEIEVAKKIIR